ncbi:MAG: hypothetical protein GSR84_05275 [Desulfurococcales archaeon]|nr:hypothetical protein [Desulfurococcales archaeon]
MLRTLAVEIEPRYITPAMIRNALTAALKEGTPEAAARRFTMALAGELFYPDGGQEGSSLIKPLGGDPAGLLATCAGGDIPVMLSTRETRLDTQDLNNQIARALLYVAEQYDRGEPKEQGYALCLQDKDGNPISRDDQLCYGRYIDEKVVGQLFSLRSAASFAAPCTLATAACEAKWLGIGAVAGLVEGALGCVLPLGASMYFGAKDKVLEELKEGGDVSLTSVWMPAVGGALAVGGLTLGEQIFLDMPARRAAEYLLQWEEEGRIHKPRLVTKRFLEKTVDAAFRDLTGTSLDPKLEARILANLKPRDARVLKYVCAEGCSQEFLKKMANQEWKNARAQLYSEFIKKAWQEMENTVAEKLKKNVYKEVAEKVANLLKNEELDNKLGNYLKKKMLEGGITDFTKAKKVRENLIDFILKRKSLPNDAQIHQILEQSEIKRGNPGYDNIYNTVKGWVEKERKEGLEDLLEAIKNPKENPAKALQTAKQLGLISGDEAKQLEEALKRRPTQALQQIKDKLFEESGRPKKEVLRKVMTSDDPFTAVAEEIGKASELEEVLQGIANNMRSIAEGAEEGLTRPSQTTPRKSLKRSLGCTVLGYIAGTAVSAKLTPLGELLNLPALTITLQDQPPTLTLGNKVIGG